MAVKEPQILKADNIFPIGEAFIDLIYGKIRQGKTYTGTAMVWQLLRQGNVVYASWPIEFDGYDERKVWYYRVLKFLGLKKTFLVIPKENLHYFNYIGMSHEEFFDYFRSKTDCVFVIDEAQRHLDSYIGTKLSIEDRMDIFVTGHKNRAIKLITQRPMQIPTALRGNIARYYKIEKTFDGWWIIPPYFHMTEFQDLQTDGIPDETRVMEWSEEENMLVETKEYKHAESETGFFLNTKTAGSYDSKYLRGDMEPSQENLAHKVRYPRLIDWINEKVIHRSVAK